MITFRNIWFSNRPKANVRGDITFGNILFFIAGTIGIATKNGYEYGFPYWHNSEYFVNELPSVKPGEYVMIEIPEGDFSGFGFPDWCSIFGYMQSEKYFAHCKDLIRHYFTLKDRGETQYKDCVLIHCRNYAQQYLDIGFTNMPREYYMEALKYFPDKRVIVVTDNIEEARKTIGQDYKYVSNTPIEDFYLMSKAENLIMSNSTFSWWAAWLSGAKTVVPKDWFPRLPVSTRDVNCDNWIQI